MTIQLSLAFAFAGLACGASNSTGSSSSSSATTGTGSGAGSTTGSATGSSGGSTGGSTAGSSSGPTGGSSTGVADAGPTCLDASSFASAFTISDGAFCAVAIYTANEALPIGAFPSWGNHHGPLVVTADAADGGVTLERWSVVPGTSALSQQGTHVPGVIPTGAYLGAQARDLPFFGWTTVTWTGPSPSTLGEIVALAGGAIAGSYPANGPYWVAGVSDGQGQGRLLYTGLSPLGSTGTSTNGLYAADACSSPSQQLGAGTGCSASALVSAWDDETGPVALDEDGNAFAVFSSATSGFQDARGFVAANVARGQGASAGVPLFTTDGFPGALAAITPTPTSTGLLVLQPLDSSTGDALDVVEQAYTAGTDIAASGTATTLLHMTAVSTSALSLMTDDSDRLWVGYAGSGTTTYVVLTRVP